MKWVKTYESFVYDELNEREYRKDVESSILQDLFYDSDSQELTITFTNGSVYKYYEVPVETYKLLADFKNILQKAGAKLKKFFRPEEAEEEEKAKGSYGTRFWALIRRGGYRYEKIQ